MHQAYLNQVKSLVAHLPNPSPSDQFHASQAWFQMLRMWSPTYAKSETARALAEKVSQQPDPMALDWHATALEVLGGTGNTRAYLHVLGFVLRYIHDLNMGRRTKYLSPDEFRLFVLLSDGTVPTNYTLPWLG